PVPHFVVFYNGNLNAPEHEILRLSDAFEHETDEPELELICHVYNINRGNNTQLLEKCTTLREYMYFVDLVRDNHATMEHLEEAIQKAIDQCIRENVLKDFLKEYGAEVMHMMTLDFTFERRLELQREEALEEGKCELIRKKILKQKTLEQIADELEETPDEIRPLYDRIAKELQKHTHSISESDDK
ncbi:MAG: transposase, partial [bacterium]|nr:transposase [bacterium]